MKNYLLSFLATLLALAAFSSASAVTLPYETTMTPDEGWTVVDVNADGTTWYESNSSFDGVDYDKGMVYKYHSSNDANDWLISPAIHLEAGKTYKVAHWGKRYNTSADKYSIYFGDTSEPATLLENGEKIFDSQESGLTNSFLQFKQYVTVDSDGDYYFGFYNNTAKNLWYSYITGFTLEEFVPHPGAVTGVTLAYGEQGALEGTLTWEWPTVDDSGKEYTGTILGAKIYRSDVFNFKASDDNLIATTTGSGTTYVDNTVPKAGTWYYRVIPYDANGASTETSAVVSAWIGSDIPKAVTNVVATLDEADDTKVSITFDYPAATGDHNQYVNLDEVYYKIVRTGGTTVTVENAWKGELPYVDTLPGLNVYQYQIHVVDSEGNALRTSGYGLSNSVTGGGKINLPYTNEFESTSDVALWTLLTNNSTSSNKWSVANGKLQSAKGYIYSTSAPNDSWAFLPPIEFEAGKSYTISFDVSVPTNGYPNTLRLYIGTENTIDDMKAEGREFGVIDEIRWTSMERREGFFSVEETGEYYIALWDNSTTSSYTTLYIDNLEVDEFINSPAAPDNFTATADFNGAKKILLKWNNPTKGVDGSNLSSIEKIEVYRSMSASEPGDLIYTETTNLTPGAEVTYEDATGLDTDGFYYYTLKPYLNNTNRESATAKSTWLGSDELGTVSNVVAVPSAGTPDAIDITFDAARGVNGGYADLTGVTYKITRRVGTGDETVVTESFDGLNFPYTDTTLPSLNAYIYTVYTVKDGVAATTGVASNKAIGGGTAALPYTNTFDTADSFDLLTVLNESEVSTAQTWRYNYGNAYIYNYGTEHINAWLITPEFTFTPGDYRIMFDIYDSNSSGANLEVLLGSGTTSSSFNETIFENQKIYGSSTSPIKVDTWFTVTEEGRYNIAFHVDDDNYGSAMYLYMDNLRIMANPTAPAVVTASTVPVVSPPLAKTVARK